MTTLAGLALLAGLVGLIGLVGQTGLAGLALAPPAAWAQPPAPQASDASSPASASNVVGASSKAGATTAPAKAAKARRKAAKSATAKPARPQEPQKPALSAAELQSPYSAPPGGERADRLLLDPDAALSRPGSGQEDADLPLSLRLGREQVTDPVTGKELTRRPDAAGAKEDLRNLRLKDALDKLGGKAEVQVDILKF